MRVIGYPTTGQLHGCASGPRVPGEQGTKVLRRVTWGQWTEGLPASGPTYISNAMSVADNLGTADNVIACGDVITRYTMTDLAVPAGHNYAHLAFCNGENCHNACYFTW
ncbi:hypothetical protein ACLEPN_41910 [Myxococcus sp. 1LA]